jgi:hypothetical protein
MKSVLVSFILSLILFSSCKKEENEFGPRHMIIKEVIATPDEEESITIMNNGSESVNLKGWTISSKKNTEIITWGSSAVNSPGETATFYGNTGHFTIDDTNEEITLKNANGEVIHSISF